MPHDTYLRPRSQDYAAAIQIADREQAAGNFEAAVSIYRLVLSQVPGYVEGQAKLARALFCLRQWEDAWRAFDVRFKLMDVPPTLSARDGEGRPRHMPRLTRGPAPKSLLVLSEQGMGDTIQFCRFLPQLVEAGVDVQAVIPERLFGLLRTLSPGLPFLPGETPGVVANVTNWTTMMDLPLLLGLKEEDYNAREPYLRADPVRIARWRAWLGERKAR